MSLGLGRRARQRQRRLRLLKWMSIFGVFLALGIFSYVSGSKLAEAEVDRLRAELGRIKQTLAGLRQDNARQRADASSARTRETAWRERYEKEVPTGETKDLLSQLRTQLAQGVKGERLRFMIRAAANTASCQGEPISKRFLVRTPIWAGANDSVNFADKTLTITAEGESAMSSLGNPEAWFDPAKPLTVMFTQLGGKRVTQASGVLPLHHSVVMRNVEYRFSIVDAKRQGFVNVTTDRCPLSPKSAKSTRDAGKIMTLTPPPKAPTEAASRADQRPEEIRE